MLDGDPVTEKLCAARQARIETRLDMMDRALSVYRSELDRRLLALNDLRKEVTEDRSQLIGKGIYDGKMAENDNRHLLLYNRVTSLETRAATWTIAVGIFFAILQIGLHFLAK